ASVTIWVLASPGSVTRSGRLMPTSVQAAASSAMRPTPKRTAVGYDQLPRMVSGERAGVLIAPSIIHIREAGYHHRDTENTEEDEISDDEATKAILQDYAIEVQQEAGLVRAKPEIRKHLRFVDWHQPIDSFDLQNQFFLDDNVHQIAALKM